MAGVLEKVFGSVFFIIIYAFIPFTSKWIINLTPGDVSRQIANLHLLFNILSAICVFPCVKLIAMIVQKFIPEDTKDEFSSEKLLYLDPEVMTNAPVAVAQAKQELIRMATLTYNNFKTSIDDFFDGSNDAFDSIMKTEKTINYLNHEITGCLIRLHGQALNAHDEEVVGMMFRVVANIERIGDHAENIAEYSKVKTEEKISLSDSGRDELMDISDKTLKVIELAIKIYDNESYELLDQISSMEEEIDELKEQYIEAHIARLKTIKCNPRGGVIFTDMVTDLERCSDHAINIAYAIKGEKALKVKKSYVLGEAD